MRQKSAPEKRKGHVISYRVPQEVYAVLDRQAQKELATVGQIARRYMVQGLRKEAKVA